MRRSLFISCFLIIVVLIVSCNQSVQKSGPEDLGLSGDTLELADIAMQTFIDSGNYAGIVVRTIKDGEIAHNKCYGYSDLESQTPIKEDDIFRMFSMTKPIVAAALMTLYEDGKFLLDDAVADYIPCFSETKVYSEANGVVTMVDQESPLKIRHLLTHTSGIPYGWDRKHYVDSLYRASGLGSYNGTIEDMVKVLASLPLKTQPGTRYEYGLSLDVSGYLVEVLSGKTLDVYLEEEIFNPLGMDDTGFYVPEEKRERFTTLYGRDKEGSLYAASNEQEQGYTKPVINLSGGAGLVSTIGDYERFARMLLYGGELDGVRVLKESTVNMIMTDQLPEGVYYIKGKEGYGLGGSVNLETGQYGWSGAASTAFQVYPETEMICLAFSQLFWSDYTFSNTYRSIVNRALIVD